MFVKYVTAATSTIAQVCNDLAKLCTGAAIASLSASCDKVNTTILANTTAPGWTLLDAAAPTNGTLITAPDADGLTTKHLNIGGASTYVQFSAYETYNAGTHTGTNIVSGATSFTYSQTAVNTFYLFVTPRTVFLMPATGATLFQASLEVTREAQYLKGTAYPAHLIAGAAFFGGTVNSGCCPKVKNQAAAGDLTATSAISICALAPVGYAGYPPNQTCRDATDSQYHVLMPIYAGLATSSYAYPLIMGRIYDLQFTTYGYGNALDTVSDGTTTHFVVVYTYRIAVPMV